MNLFPSAGTFVVFDMEWTSWEGAMERNWSGLNEHRELIQIGAVRIDANSLREIDSFSCLLKPVKNPILSDYISRLTGISNEEVRSKGLDFASGLDLFARFVGSDMSFCNGGDGEVLKENFLLNNLLPMPFIESCRSIRPWLSSVIGLAPGSLMSCKLPSLLGLPDTFDAHDALGDARAIASAMRECFRMLKARPGTA